MFLTQRLQIHFATDILTPRNTPIPQYNLCQSLSYLEFFTIFVDGKTTSTFSQYRVLWFTCGKGESYSVEHYHCQSVFVQRNSVDKHALRASTETQCCAKWIIVSYRERRTSHYLYLLKPFTTDSTHCSGIETCDASFSSLRNANKV
jgi:hypothetical protein